MSDEINQLKNTIELLRLANERYINQNAEKEGLLCQLLREIDELKAVIRDVPTGFYADKNTYLRRGRIDIAREITSVDCDDLKGYAMFCGGKRAREFELKHQEILKRIRGEG